MNHRRHLRPLAIVFGAIVLALAVSACGIGHKSSHPVQGEEDGTASSGFYVKAGNVTYQVQLSRALNPYDTSEDAQYIRGVPVAKQKLLPDQEWLGVFLWAKNQSKQTQHTASPSQIKITDTLGNAYHPYILSDAENPIAYKAVKLRPQQTYPMADTPGSVDPAQGMELLFKVNTTVYSNRPLLLNIAVPGYPTAKVSLDL